MLSIGPRLGGEEYLSSAGDSWRIGDDGLSGDVALLGGGDIDLAGGSGLDGLKLPPLDGWAVLRNSVSSPYVTLASPSVSILLMMERSSLSVAKCPCPWRKFLRL